MTIGVVVLLFAVYQLWGTGLATAREQERLAGDLRQEWARTPTEPTESIDPTATPIPVAYSGGQALAVLHVPAITGYEAKIVVEGVDVADLKKGPGHLPGSAMPGELGNVVLSGHRTTYGAPFGRFDELDPGEQVVLETREGWYTYDVVGSQIVAPTAVEVTFPVPGQQGVTPTKRLITLTTCNPKYSARQRLIVSGELTRVTTRAEGPPPSLPI